MSIPTQRAIAESVLKELELMVSECGSRDELCVYCREIVVVLKELRAALGKKQAEA